MLPAPLAVNRAPGTSSPSMSGRTSEESPFGPDTGSRARLLSSSPRSETDVYGSDSYQTGYGPQRNSPNEYYSPSPPTSQIETYVNRAGVGSGGGQPVMRHATTSSAHPGETQNPYRHAQPQSAGYGAQQVNGFDDGESDETQSSNASAQPTPRARGVSLADNGPVPSGEGQGVRRLARPSARRPSSQQPTNRYSRQSLYGSSGPIPSLPPGAASPRYGDY